MKSVYLFKASTDYSTISFFSIIQPYTLQNTAPNIDSSARVKTRNLPVVNSCCVWVNTIGNKPKKPINMPINFLRDIVSFNTKKATNAATNGDRL